MAAADSAFPSRSGEAAEIHRRPQPGSPHPAAHVGMTRMADDPQAVKALVAEMLSPQIAEALANTRNSGEFGAHLGKLAYDYVFGELWSRPGLDRRSRSLVTLGILIALRATEELHYHIPAALK